LLRARPTGTPMLVFAASGQDARLQETTLWMTRRVLRGFHELPSTSRPARLLLAPVPGERADLAGPPRPKAGTLPSLIALYRAAGYRYGVDWRILAAINRVETNYGSNTSTSSAGAVGWMQFLPSTWRRWGVDASGDGVADPYDPQDAIFSAARYLDAAGARTDLRRAIFAYNHADWYVNEVLAIAASIPESYGS
jgi:soluble lytic murein transglycosylase-like protein